VQQAFYRVYLDRKNHPLGRHIITLGTAICADPSLHSRPIACTPLPNQCPPGDSVFFTASCAARTRRSMNGFGST
jgi:hypothetical protein